MLDVAPLVGAWIEIWQKSGKKLVEIVAPLVGAWIEIDRAERIQDPGSSRSPRGSVY